MHHFRIKHLSGRAAEKGELESLIGAWHGGKESSVLAVLSAQLLAAIAHLCVYLIAEFSPLPSFQAPAPESLHLCLLL